MATDKGFIGYNGARHLATGRAPQHIQNMVICDYCCRHDLTFKLSASEYTMPHCYMMLDKLVEEISQHDGIVMYSMFMLPARTTRRRALYKRILGAGASLHRGGRGFGASDRYRPYPLGRYSARASTSRQHQPGF